MLVFLYHNKRQIKPHYPFSRNLLWQTSKAPIIHVTSHIYYIGRPTYTYPNTLPNINVHSIIPIGTVLTPTTRHFCGKTNQNTLPPTKLCIIHVFYMCIKCELVREMNSFVLKGISAVCLWVRMRSFVKLVYLHANSQSTWHHTHTHIHTLIHTKPLTRSTIQQGTNNTVRRRWKKVYRKPIPRSRWCSQHTTHTKMSRSFSQWGFNIDLIKFEVRRRRITA